MSLVNEQEVVRRAGRQAINAFLDAHNCFSVVRNSGKVVVFDTRIPIQLAFYALVEHDMLAAPLWDPNICQFVGLLQVTDFIDILRHYRLTQSNVASLATRSIAEIFQDQTLREAVGMTLGFPCADSSTTLKQACQLLLKTAATSSSRPGGAGHFLPIVMPEDMRVLACITYTNILEHLVTNFREQRRLFDDSIYDLQIGTYHEKLITVTPQHTLADALALMHQHGLSALPVVVTTRLQDILNDNNNNNNNNQAQHPNDPPLTTAPLSSSSVDQQQQAQQSQQQQSQQSQPSSASSPDTLVTQLVGVYSRADITFLTKATDAQDAVANLDLKLADVLEQQHHQRNDVTTPDALHTCSTLHTLQSIFEYFAQWKFNRLFVVDETTKGIVGVVSAKDLVAYFMKE